MGDRRAQSPIDFALGVSVFVLAILFVVVFFPQITEPFERGASGETVVVDGAATELSERLLGAPSKPHVLDTDCTVGLFDDADTICGYDASRPLAEQLGVSDFRNLQVEIVSDLDGDGDEERVCWDDTTDQFVGATLAGCDVPFVAGDDPSSAASTSTARRSVAIDGTGATVVVRGW